MLPATSVATIGMALGPTASGTLHEKLPDDKVAAWPPQVTPARPESESAAVPETRTVALLTFELLAGERTFSVGAVLSSLTDTAALAVLPAPSVATAATGCVPSVVTRVMPGQVAEPPAPPTH